MRASGKPDYIAMLKLLPLISQLRQFQAVCSGPHASSLLHQAAAACTSTSTSATANQPSIGSDDRASSGARCSISGWSTLAGVGMLHCSHRLFSSVAQMHAPDYAVGLHNLRDNPGALRKGIRLGRGDRARKGNYSGRGMKGLKARGRAHILYDGGQLGLLKFPITRERPSYEVLYNQLGISRVIEYIQLGLLDHTQLITMKDLQDCGCVMNDIKYGVLLYGQAAGAISFPMHIQVTACDPNVREAIEAAGGSVTRVYYAADGLRALLHPEQFLSRGPPLPQPPPGWHPKHNGKFDAVGQLPPSHKRFSMLQAANDRPTTAQSAA